ncbi:MAG TPA: hypothetical protein ENG13_00205, partial [bacterium]|nr:hypothetical protein [bacterium]HEX67476.1 hypothetical protein [bacterium]
MSRKYRLSKTFLLFVFFLFAGSCIYSQNQTKLIFGPAVSGLKGTNISTSEFREVRAPGEEKLEILSFKLNLEEVSLHKAGGYDYVKIGNLRPLARPGEPHLPAKVFVVTLPKNTEILGVDVENILYHPILTPLNILPTPQPVQLKRGMETRRIIKNKRIYS